MKRYFAFFVAICFAAGCSSSPSGSSSAEGPKSENEAAFDKPQANENVIPAPPAGAMYTLHYAVFTGPTHLMEAKRIKETLIRSTKSNEWYVIHGEEESDLYYGYYKTFEDQTQAAEYARAQTDRMKVSSLVDNNGEVIFPQVAFASINLPDPPAPPEWDLSHNPGYWTLQIAVYRGSPERKQAAVDAVRAFREHGVEAYFRHGAGTSEVYIGSWPKESVAQQDDSVAETETPDEHLLVVPGDLPKGVDPDKLYDSSGRKMKVVMPKLQIVDPKLKMATEQYPYYYVNGEVAGRKAQMADHSVQTVPWPSYLIQVPHENVDQSQQDKNDQGQNAGQVEGGSQSVPGLGGLAR
jgi:hypothetical protein